MLKFFANFSSFDVLSLIVSSLYCFCFRCSQIIVTLSILKFRKLSGAPARDSTELMICFLRSSEAYVQSIRRDTFWVIVMVDYSLELQNLSSISNFE